MPKLLVFVPCEKVIISADENNPTLIAVLTRVGGVYQVQPGEKFVASKAVAPMRWSIFTMWRRGDRERPKECQQRIVFRDPSQKERVKSDLTFIVEKRNHRITSSLGTVPLSPSGTWALEVYLRKKTARGWPDWPKKPLAVYPIDLQFTLDKAGKGSVAP